MIVMMIAAVIGGIVLSQYSLLPVTVIHYSGNLTTYMLYLLLLLIGYDIGKDKSTLSKLFSSDKKLFFIPLGTIIGTLTGGLLAAFVIGLSISDSLAISAGFGWYSLSAVLIADSRGGDLGSVAFLTNVFREIISILLIPVLAKYLGPYATIPAGGATTMDTTLPLIEKYAGGSAAFVAFIHGFVLSSLVPILVPLFL
jgi:uncharacterized membrane protein YbjE (DUF340 family)